MLEIVRSAPAHLTGAGLQQIGSLELFHPRRIGPFARNSYRSNARRKRHGRRDLIIGNAFEGLFAQQPHFIQFGQHTGIDRYRLPLQYQPQ